MPVHLRLVHAEPGSRVVEASALHQGEVLAMALGEGPTAAAAEDQARQRLERRLGELPALPATTPADREATASHPVPAAAPVPAPTALPAVEEPAPDPEDWSAELARIDLALRRIGWQREQEGHYLERAFGHPSRSRLTTYNDLLAYLRLVEALEPGADPRTAAVPLRRGDLLEQSDGLLARLGWDALRGRQFLEQHLGRGSRQQLNDSELLQFNMLLEEALLAAGPAGRPATVD
ncbi:MAG: hypothetical protein KFB97_06665 [Cyanobium sp. M30B3]|jgi:hypothetical protein|nr:MAG: hypothetical protein KFB97_06665 [Cyanobium sp. M30B3]